MDVSGFTILRHVGPLGYPFIESIRSVLPLVDNFVVVIASDDEDSDRAVAALGDPRIRIVRSDWSSAGIGGVELARQTNIALEHCTGAWAIYAQADELIHEDDHPRLRAAMREHLDADTEGLLFDYLHFFRSYRWVANDWHAFYPRAVRVIRLGRGVESAGDAAGFVVRRGRTTRGLIKAHSRARIFHYGWAGPADLRLARAHALRELFESGASTLTLADITERTELWQNNRWALRRYDESHPSPMHARIAEDAGTFMPGAVVKTPAWFRAWRDALCSPRSFRSWARPLLPLALSNMRWRMMERRREP